MATIAKISIELAANSAKMVSELKKTNRKIDSFAKKAKKSINVMKAAFLATAAAMTFKFAKGALDAGDEIQKLSIRLGATTEALSQFQHVANLSGVTFRTFVMGLQRSTRRISEAAAGTGEAKKALEELGLSAKELNKLRPEQQFEVLAEALSQVENQADKVRLSMKFFDSEGVALLQTMENGAEGIREMRKEADKLGLTLSRDNVDAMADANDALTRLSASGVQLRNVLATSLGPAIASIANWLSVNLPNAIEVTRKGIVIYLEVFGRAVEKMFTFQSTVLKVFGHLPGFVGEKFNLAAGAIENFEQKIQDSISAMQQNIAPSPVEKFQSDVEGAALSLDDFSNTYEVWTKSMDDYFDTLSKTMSKVGESSTKTKDDFDQMSVFADQAARNMQSTFADFLFDPFEDGLGGMLKSFGETMRRMAAEMLASRVFQAVGSSLAGSGNATLAGMGNFFAPSGARANGGPVSAGKSFLVGERGPELFIPGVSGNIAANDKLGGQSVVISQHFDFRNAQKGAASELRREAKRIQDNTLAAVRSEISGGGQMARSVGVKR